MKDEIKEIYLSNLEWFKTQDDIGVVNGNITFKNSMSLKEFEKILDNTYVMLCDKDYITNLQENARGQVNDYFKDKYADEVLKNANLQEENQKLKELCDKYEEEHSNEFKIWKDERSQLIDYKSRNEKYEKVINEIKEKIDDYFGYDYENESQARLDTINEINYITVDLYNGGDEE